MRLAFLLFPLVLQSASAQTVEYRYDDVSDNTTSINAGPPPSFGTPDMLRVNYFATEPGGEARRELSVRLDPAAFRQAEIRLRCGCSRTPTPPWTRATPSRSRAPSFRA